MFSTEKLQICPYWRQYVIFGEHALALCGANSYDEQSLADDGGRVDFCPLLWGAEKAYERPAILRLRRVDGSWLEEKNHALVAGLNGEEGIRQLEERWPQEKANFRKEVSNL